MSLSVAAPPHIREPVGFRRTVACRQEGAIPPVAGWPYWGPTDPSGSNGYVKIQGFVTSSWLCSPPNRKTHYTLPLAYAEFQNGAPILTITTLVALWLLLWKNIKQSVMFAWHSRCSVKLCNDMISLVFVVVYRCRRPPQICLHIRHNDDVSSGGDTWHFSPTTSVALCRIVGIA